MPPVLFSNVRTGFLKELDELEELEIAEDCEELDELGALDEFKVEETLLEELGSEMLEMATGAVELFPPNQSSIQPSSSKWGAEESSLELFCIEELGAIEELLMA